MNRAKDDEMTFVLLGRDAAAPVAIRAWVTERIRLGKNSLEDKDSAELKLAEMLGRKAKRERGEGK
jgi:hypothetical protein